MAPDSSWIGLLEINLIQFASGASRHAASALGKVLDDGLPRSGLIQCKPADGHSRHGRTKKRRPERPPQAGSCPTKNESSFATGYSNSSGTGHPGTRTSRRARHASGEYLAGI